MMTDRAMLGVIPASDVARCSQRRVSVGKLWADWTAPVTAGGMPLDESEVNAPEGERPHWWAAGFGALAGAAVFATARHGLSDDSFITLDYARTLAEHGQWGMVPGLTSNTATSPLNVWLLAVGIIATGRPVLAVGALLIATLAAAGWWGARLGETLDLSRGLPFVLVGLLATSPLLISNVGLETYLGAALLVAVAHYTVAGRPVVTGALCGLAVLCRPDLAVPVGVLVVGLLPARRWPSTAGVAVLVAAPWHLWSWFALGGFVPDTLWFKSGENSWEGHTLLSEAVLYWRLFPAATALVLATVVLGVAGAAVGRQRVAVVAAAAGLAHFAAVSALDTPPYAWYFAPLVASCALAAAVTAADARPAVVATVGLTVAGVGFLAQTSWDQGPITYNWGTAAEYAAVGRDVAAITRGELVATAMEIGTVVYFCDGCQLHEPFTDPALGQATIDHRYAQAGRLTRWLMDVNFTHRRPPVEPRPAWTLTADGSVAASPGAQVWPLTSSAHPPTNVVLRRLG
jgi:hypothetical protein